MSMICWVLGLSPVQIGALRTTPSLASDLAQMKQDEQFQTDFAAQAPEEVDALNTAVRARLERLGPLEQALNLEKSWHILHYMFTGHVDDAKALGDTLLTGEPLGDDVGYGPARLHNSEETRDFARFLTSLDLSRLQEQIHYREMSQIGVYSMPMGPGSDAEHEAELRMEIASYFPQLREYVVRMAEKQNGLLVWLS